MSANVYECMILLDTNKVAGDVPAAAKQLQSILERHKAEVLASRPWDERKLAYAVKGHKKGLFYLIYFRSEGPSLKDIEHDFALSELVLRAMILKIAPKMVDVMLALAKDEHALALQTVSVDQPESDIPVPFGDFDEPHGGGGRGRGGHRRD